jgi:LacI family transcriptional regulator
MATDEQNINKLLHKPTIHDIAQRLDISFTSVYRALNDKPKVSKETRARVLETAKEMGYETNRVAKSLSSKAFKIGMLVSESGFEYTRQLISGAQYAFKELKDYKVFGDIFISNRISFMDRKAEILDKVNQYISEEYDGIIFNVPTSLFTMKDKALLKDCPVIATVATDLDTNLRAFTVRPDGKVAGKIARQMLSWIVGDKPVAVFTGFKDVEIHKENIDGFYENASDFPLDLIGIYENQDNPDIAYYSTGSLLESHPEVGGIYVNSSNSIVICKKLKEAGRAGDIKLITTDVFNELNEYMEDGTIHATIYQNPFEQGRIVVNQLYALLSGQKKVQKDILIKPQIIIKSNFTEYYSDNFHTLIG